MDPDGDVGAGTAAGRPICGVRSPRREKWATTRFQQARRPARHRDLSQASERLTPEQGACFELVFVKAWGLFGADVETIEAASKAGDDGKGCLDLEGSRRGDGGPYREACGVRACREKPARCEGVKVSDSEGLANHTGPESCAVVGDGCGEALTGERVGRVLSPEIKVLSRCRRAPNTRKAIRHTPTQGEA
jgi:hypothetical protein